MEKKLTWAKNMKNSKNACKNLEIYMNFKH